MSRPTSAHGRLARYGFGVGDHDTTGRDGGGRAADLLGPGGLGLWDATAQEPVDEPAGELLAALSRAADPDLALRQLHRIVEAERRAAAHGEDAFPHPGQSGRPGSALLTALQADPGLRRRLVAVLGASSALGDHLVANPDHWRALSSGADGLPPSADGALYPEAAGLPAGVGAPSAGAAGTSAGAAGTSAGGAGTSAGGAGPSAGGAGTSAGGAGTSAGGAGLPAQPAGLPAVAALRRAYRLALLRIAAADLTGGRALEQTMAALSALADATLTAAYGIAAGELPAGTPPPRLGVVAMGKCGGGELNYVSDVDVIFVAAADEDLAAGTLVATRLIYICGLVAWPVDVALRPEGSRGPLVRTLASHLAYYQRWARTWEFQALLKARPVAGDTELAREWVDRLAPLVWQAAERPEAVEDVRAMRRKIIDNIPPRELEREIKRGPGGLRDIEFAVQLLQLVHGRVDESLRSRGTIPALGALVAGGYVGRADGEALLRGYRFLRAVEHRLQLQGLRRTHTVPVDRAALRWLAQALGYTAGPERYAVDAFRADWVAHATEVRRLHAKLLYRPLLEAVARVPADGLRMTPEAARERLEILGFADPAGALRHLQALTGGVTRTAAIQRTLLPVLLQEFADAPEPDRGLLNYRQVSDKLGGTPWYLRLLRDEGLVASRLARTLALSRYVADLLARDPEALRLLAEDAELTPRGAEVLRDGLISAAARHLGGRGPQPADPIEAIRAVRALRRRELIRVACGDVLRRAGPLAPLPGAPPAPAGPLAPLPGAPPTRAGRRGAGLSGAGLSGAGLSGAGEPVAAPAVGGALFDVNAVGGALFDVTAVGAALSDVTDATLAAALRVARAIQPPMPGLRFAVIGMGRLGGYEMNYLSDADVLFVYDPPPGVAEDAASGAAHAIAEELRRLLGVPAPDPPLGVDADLRPEGRQGPLVRSLGAYAQYYARWSKVWEAQALLRARYVCGDADLGAEFEAVADPVRYSEQGLTREQVVEIRRIKVRVETERLPRGADPATHTKLGRGGLADVEWAVQLVQLRHAGVMPALRCTRTLDALAATRDAGLIGAADAAAMAAGWTRAAQVRNALMLVRGRAGDQLPRHGVELAGVVRLLGGHDPGEFLDDYLRTGRRCRAAVERVLDA